MENAPVKRLGANSTKVNLYQNRVASIATLRPVTLFGRAG